MTHLNQSNNPFLEMGREEFLKFLDSVGVSYTETTGAGKIVFENDFQSFFPKMESTQRVKNQATAIYSNSETDMILAA
jgi:hypothetical protein